MPTLRVGVKSVSLIDLSSTSHYTSNGNTCSALRQMTFPWTAHALTAFGVAYGILLHRAVVERVYRITGLRILDAYLLAWLIGLASGYTPLCLYLAFGFKELDTSTAGGRFYTLWIHRVARLEVLFFVLYALFILITVPQRQSEPLTGQQIEQTIISNIIFALIAVLFGILASAVRRKQK